MSNSNKGKLKSSIPNKGEKFNYWTILDNTPIETSKRNWSIKCECLCGKISLVRIYGLVNGLSKGCPCRAYDMMKESKIYVGDISDTFWNRIIKSAGIRKIKFNISKEYAWELFLKQNKKCALSGMDIIMNKSISRVKGKSNITASIDRIDSSLGYEIDNIQWVHKDVNKMKQDFKEEYFLKFCKLITIKSKLE